MTTTTNTLSCAQQALKIDSPGVLNLCSSAPLPSCRPDQVLIQVANIALNPVDAKSADLSPTPGATSGADFVGTVVDVGPTLRRALNVGDQVFGCVFGNNPDEKENGAFAQYVVAYADLVWKVPKGMSLETASCLGVGLVTIGLALYFNMGLRLPRSPADKADHNEGQCRASEKQFVLIYGGGTATGMLAIQMLRLSNYIPLVTCSPHSEARCLALGAAACFDYHSPTCGADVRSYTENKLYYAFDCISSPDSLRICYAAIAAPAPALKGQKPETYSIQKARYVALDPFPVRAHTRRSIIPSWIIAFTVLDQPVNWQHPFQREAKPAHRNWAGRIWFGLVQKLLEQGMIKGPEVEIRQGGLGSVMDGLADIRMGKVGGRKLVYAV